MNYGAECLTARFPTGRLLCQGITNDLSNTVFGDALAQAILGLKPTGQGLRSFARITGHAAGDVLLADDPSVVDYVLHDGRSLLDFGGMAKGNITIDALLIPLDYDQF